MLQYDEQGNGHIIWDEKNQLDYTIRMQQFFDHYLKDQLAPKWMTKGGPSMLNQVETGLELDPSGSCEAICDVCKKLHRKVKSENVVSKK
jgi:hypothetical protein